MYKLLVLFEGFFNLFQEWQNTSTALSFQLMGTQMHAKPWPSKDISVSFCQWASTENFPLRQFNLILNALLNLFWNQVSVINKLSFDD